MTTTVCTHPHAHIGLDGIYCPDCHTTFEEKTRTYHQLLFRLRECQHQFRPLWQSDSTLVEYCSCGKSHPASPETLQTAIDNCSDVREEYLVEVQKAKASSKQNFLDAVERLDAQIQWCKEQLELFGMETPMLPEPPEPPEPKPPEPMEPDAPQLSVEPEPAEELEVAAVTVEVMETLAADEECDRQSLELRVEKAFYEAGVALRELRDRRLYRSTHKTWQAYCKYRFGFGRDSADLKILAAGVVDNLSQKNADDSSAKKMPTTLEQVRPLTKLQPEEQRFCWQAAVEKAGGKIPSGQIVKRVVDGLKEKEHPSYTTPADFCEVGDVFILTDLSGEERHYNGCWAIATALNSFTVGVDTYDQTLLVKPNHLKIVDDPEARRQTPSTLKRIRRLKQFDLSNCARSVLETLGRQTYLTDKEEQMLEFLEQQYGIVAHPPVTSEALANALPNLKPEQVKQVVEIAVAYGLDDNQLKALAKAAKEALNWRHHPITQVAQRTEI